MKTAETCGSAAPGLFIAIETAEDELKQSQRLNPLYQACCWEGQGG